MSNTKFKDWIKKIGIAGFLFFLVKGLVWLFIFYGLGTGIKGCGESPEEVKSHTEVIKPATDFDLLGMGSRSMEFSIESPLRIL